MLFSITSEKKKKKKESLVAENVKKLWRLLCSLPLPEKPSSCLQSTWSSNSGALCCITNNDTDLYDINEINKLVHGNAGNMSAIKKGNLCMKVCQVDGTEQVCILWPMKYCTNTGAILYSLTWEILQRNKIKK